MINLNANSYYIRAEEIDFWLLSHINLQNRVMYVTFRRMRDNFEQTVSFHVMSDRQSILPFVSIDSLSR